MTPIDLLTLREAAELVGYSDAAVLRNAIKRGRLRSVKRADLARGVVRHYVTRTDLLAYYERTATSINRGQNR